MCGHFSIDVDIRLLQVTPLEKNKHRLYSNSLSKFFYLRFFQLLGVYLICAVAVFYILTVAPVDSFSSATVHRPQHY